MSGLALKEEANAASIDLLSNARLTLMSCLDKAFSLCAKNARYDSNHSSASSNDMDCMSSSFGFSMSSILVLPPDAFC